MTTPDCTNDCVAPLRFPQRPLNRPGLPHLAYRIGTYADIRQALLRNLNKDPVLAGWTHQSPDDPGIALLEGAAVLGDILTFYQELYANEAYLSTARWREDVADLVRLLGYRLAPGLGGRGVFAFEVSGAAPVTIPKGFPVSAQVTGTGEAADFETSQELLAYPWLSRFSLFRPLWTPNITKATTELVVTGPDPFTDPVPLAKGDRLVLGRPYPAVDPARLLDGQVVVVDSVRELHGQQRFRIKGALSLSENAARLAGFKLGRSFRHVGNAAPPTMITVSNGTATQSPVGFGRSLNQTTSDNVDPDLDPKVFPLEGKIDGLAAGAPIVCQSALMGSVMLDFGVWPLPFPFRTPVVMTLIRTITEVRHGSYTWGPITGPATVAVVDRELTTEVLPAVDPWVPLRYTYDRVDIREIQFHETASPLLTIEAAPEPTPASAGHDLYFLGTDAQAQALNGRTLLLASRRSRPRPRCKRCKHWRPASPSATCCAA